MLTNRFILVCLLLVGKYAIAIASGGDSILIVKKSNDFNVTGDGSSSSWTKTNWIPITVQESDGTPLSTRAKVLYSDKGIYFLFECADRKITATLEQDNAALFREDVVEVFLWPDQTVPIYFEYEISPLNYELAILVPNMKGGIQGWLPWHYEGDRKIQHATSTQGGDKKSLSIIKSWTAEFFIPYKVLRPLVSGAPKSGERWRANLYRIDYDQGYTTWTWQKTTLGAGGNFHEYKKFGTLVFE
jgi:hypothetical protein